MDFPILERALWFIVAISVLVAAHEFGHFIVARSLGFKVLRFSIGFGRPLLSWRGGPPDHIQYWLSMIPLGGYVKMLDEHEGPVVSEERHRAFHQRPIWQRVTVLLAGQYLQRWPDTECGNHRTRERHGQCLRARQRLGDDEWRSHLDAR